MPSSIDFTKVFGPAQRVEQDQGKNAPGQTIGLEEIGTLDVKTEVILTPTTVPIPLSLYPVVDMLEPYFDDIVDRLQIIVNVTWPHVADGVPDA